MCEWAGGRRRPRGQKDRVNEDKGERDVHCLRAAGRALAFLPSGKESNWLEVLGKPPMSKGGPVLPEESPLGLHWHQLALVWGKFTPTAAKRSWLGVEESLGHQGGGRGLDHLFCKLDTRDKGWKSTPHTPFWVAKLFQL